MHAVSMLNKMVRFAGSLSFPQPGQIFTVGSISWIINANGDREIIEPVQIDSTPTTRTPTTADLILEPPPRSPPSTTRRSLPRYQRMQINNDDLITSIDRVGLKLADCLSIAESALDTLVQHRPPSDPGVAALPFRLTNIIATFQDTLRGKFAD